MTLAMMSRATLGHTGRVLEASPATQFIYLAVVVAMALRVAMEFVPNLSVPMMYGAAIAWVAAFMGFATVYGPMLARPPRRIWVRLMIGRR
ncbi:NnrS family protein [Labrys neptuniae]